MSACRSPPKTLGEGLVSQGDWRQQKNRKNPASKAAGFPEFSQSLQSQRWPYSPPQSRDFPPSAFLTASGGVLTRLELFASDHSASILQLFIEVNSSGGQLVLKGHFALTLQVLIPGSRFSCLGQVQTHPSLAYSLPADWQQVVELAPGPSHTVIMSCTDERALCSVLQDLMPIAPSSSSWSGEFLDQATKPKHVGVAAATELEPGER